eukprot:Clim_evm37s99 gene=Clim_evmTU37s99
MAPVTEEGQEITDAQGLKSTVSTEIKMELPVVDFTNCAEGDEYDLEKAKQAGDLVRKALEEYGAFVLLDPRVKPEQNDVFLRTMESYWERPAEMREKETRPHLSYQLGLTPEGVEIPRCKADTNCHKVIDNLADEDKPIKPEGADPKLRYFWRISERPKPVQKDKDGKEIPLTEEQKAKDPDFAPQVVPEGMDGFEKVMEGWGNQLLEAGQMILHCYALACGAEGDLLTKKIMNGHHLLAPTGVDLSTHNHVNTIMAGFHYDLNLLSLHGKANYPGLAIWTREGKKMEVKMPTGPYLLCQAGKQFEWLTAGKVLAGFHEVAVRESTLKVLSGKKADDGDASKRKKPQSSWRVSSTLFIHVRSDDDLYPMPELIGEEAAAAEENKVKYPRTRTGKQVMDELSAINLSGTAE